MTMPMTIIDNDHEDQGDNKEDQTDIPNDIPSEELRTQNLERAQTFEKTGKSTLWTNAGQD